jgi:excisionase family DNA binding protein
MSAKNDLPEYLTLKEVTSLLKVHENTLRNWDKNGTLKAIRIGERKIRRWKKADVIKFLESSNQ